MKSNILFCLVFAVHLSPILLHSQSIIIEGEIRPRTEYQDGYIKPIPKANDPGIFTSQRTRLGFSFRSGVLNTQITLQDARVFGQYGTSSTEASTGIYEAWSELLLAPGLTFKLGRQNIKYDDNRLFSAPTWNLLGTSHELALIKYNINDYQFHLAIGYNNNKEIAIETMYTPITKYRMLSYLWLSKPIYNGVTLSGIIIDEGLQDTVGLGNQYKKIAMNQAITYGGNLQYQDDEKPLSVLITSYFQSGKNNVGLKMDGKLLAIKTDYKFSSSLTSNLGIDYISGDTNGNSDGKQRNFKKLYGANHHFNGTMDYWNNPAIEGLVDYYGGIQYIINKKLCVDGTFHVFNTDTQLKSGGKDLGSELDLLLNYKMNEWTCLQGGYCMYFYSKNTSIAKGMNPTTQIRTPQYAYLSLCIKTTFFKN